MGELDLRAGVGGRHRRRPRPRGDPVRRPARRRRGRARPGGHRGRPVRGAARRTVREAHDPHRRARRGQCRHRHAEHRDRRGDRREPGAGVRAPRGPAHHAGRRSRRAHRHLGPRPRRRRGRPGGGAARRRHRRRGGAGGRRSGPPRRRRAHHPAARAARRPHRTRRLVGDAQPGRAGGAHHRAPRAVGNADGLPITDRDEANRAALGRDLDYLTQRRDDGQLSAAEKRVLENATYVRDALGEYADQIDPETGAALANVVVYQPGLHSGDGGIAISFGDPDTADHVSVNVPGLTSETSSTSGNLAKTLALHQAALDEGKGTVASVYWLDYDAPSGNPINPFDPLGQLDFGGVALTDKAEAGGERFGDFIDGLRASDEGDRAHLTAIGHSYGSTAVGYALHDGLPVDDAIIIGSPGQPTGTAAELTGADFWVGSMDNDPVSLLGTGDRGGIGALGHDPADVDFGGHRFETGDGALRVEKLLDNHSSYFSGTSLDNMAHVVAGNEGEVSDQPGRGAPGGDYLTLSELLAVSTTATVGDGLLAGGTWLLEHLRPGGIMVP
ncbi:hypothetical protein F9L07_08630 [Pimelobacter simplex]|uniref:DUF1023 domain-containing protein n=1 Tax=Nocardioides simplex TaxID=2045 RepID=A0A7J5E1Q8_NOCSI|nr:hypothetical protein F9L07_08630 [Pimelobacter simplex]